MPEQNQKRAFVVGKYAEGDTNVERFRETVRRLGYAYKELSHLHFAKTQPQKDDLLLFCAGPAIQDIPGWLRQIHERGRPQVVLYVDDKVISPESALDYSKFEHAVDILVWEDTSPTIINDHIALLHNPEEPIYSKIGESFAQDDGATPHAFVSTPFGGSHDMTMKHAVQPVLRECGFCVERADGPVREAAIHEQIRRQIRRSRLLVANIGECELDLSRHNPNVYFEIGLAVALDVYVLLIRQAGKPGQKILMPADVSHLRCIDYANETDLVLQLYHGLKQNKRNP